MDRLVSLVSSLGEVLRSKKEFLTLQEEKLLLDHWRRASDQFYYGFGSGAIVTWLATRKLGILFGLSLTAGAATACGLWNFGRSIESSVEHLLSLEGSRVQRELANVMLKNHNDPWVLQRLSKHFYLEAVYDDSVDRPILRWRSRNFFGDSVALSLGTSYSEETDSQNNDVRKTAVEHKQVYVKAAGGATENPFDLIFGLTGSEENIPHPDVPSTSSSRQRRRERRARRRHRGHHPEESKI